MKIVDESRVGHNSFATVRLGECFKHSGNLYMRTQSQEGIEYNAVRLNDGFLGKFKHDTGVQSVKAFVTVETKQA